MQGHRQDKVDAVFVPKKQKSPQEKFAEGPGQLNFTPVFKAMNNFRNNAVVYQRRPGNAKIFPRCDTASAIVILALPAVKRYTAAYAKGRFNRNQCRKTARAQVG